jgi:DNA-binding MarR family transcriptional regulator
VTTDLMTTDTDTGGQVAGTEPVLSARELSVWRVLLRAHATIVRRLKRDLVAGHDLPLAWYDVLVELVAQPGGRMRMTDLADRVLLSRSGLTRLVDRLVLEGLVERAACPSDARGTYTVLTADGRDRLRKAAPTHLRGVAECVTRPLSGAELDTLKGLLDKLLAAAGDHVPAAPADGEYGPAPADRAG